MRGLRFGALFLGAVGLFAGMTGASAQTAPGTIAPLQIEPDPSGLDLLGGKVQTGGPVLAIPAAPRLTYSRGSDWFINVSGEHQTYNDGPNGSDPNANYSIN